MNYESSKIDNHKEPGQEQREEALAEFRSKLGDKLFERWMTNADGEDFCPECWHKYITKFENKEIRSIVQRESEPTSDLEIAESRRLNNGYYVSCEDCDKEVFTPYNGHEEKSGS